MALLKRSYTDDRKTRYDEEIKKEFIKSLSEGLYDEYESIASNPTLLLLMLSLFRENSNFPKEKVLS